MGLYFAWLLKKLLTAKKNTLMLILWASFNYFFEQDTAGDKLRMIN